MNVIINGVAYAPVPESVTDKTVAAALDVRFDSDAGENLSVRDYLRVLLSTLWMKGEDFSGKRPFGNSGWECEIYQPLVAGGFIPGTLDEDGYVDSIDEKIAKAYVCNLILAAFYGCEPKGAK
jgi:hypothetical protein